MDIPEPYCHGYLERLAYSAGYAKAKDEIKRPRRRRRGIVELSERLWVSASLDSKQRPTEYVRGDIVESIRQRRRDAKVEVERLQAIVQAQGEIIDWYETETDRDNAEEEDVVLDLRELEIVLKAAEAKEEES